VKKLVIALSCILLLSACASSAPPASSKPVAAGEIEISAEATPPVVPQEASVPVMASAPATPEEPVPTTPEETVEAYFRRQYEAYVDLTAPDISPLLDMEQQANQNLVVWLQTLAQRRRLLAEHDLCYVEQQTFPYTITYEEEATDGGSRWRNRQEADKVVYFRITGEAGRAYPPIMAMNAQHIMALNQEGDSWKIVSHYYPGAVRSFMRTGELTLPTESDMLANLREEFAGEVVANTGSVPGGAAAYNGSYAVDYALRYTESPNTDFYIISDWMGNCANFVSQAVWAGFGDSSSSGRMTNTWYAGGGGGSPAWENVGHFWNYATDVSGMGGQILSTVAEMRPGDVLQVRNADAGDEERYNHMLLLVDKEKLIFAQNSPANFVHYSDVFNKETRLVRPRYLYG
jgi:hypothetical protein